MSFWLGLTLWIAIGTWVSSIQYERWSEKTKSLWASDPVETTLWLGLCALVWPLVIAVAAVMTIGRVALRMAARRAASRAARERAAASQRAGGGAG